MSKSFFDTALECVQQTKPIFIHGYHTVKSIEYKGDTDPVTTVDQAVEEKVTEIILYNYPDHKILAEEGHHLSKSGGYRWIIDPLDGTVNFAHNVPHFALSIGLEQDGEMILGVVYNPITNELFTAEKGKGALLNGSPIKVSTVNDIKKSLISTGFPYDSWTNGDQYTSELNKVLKACQGIRRAGAASLDLCYVACGRYDAFWERQLKPWDVAASLIILSEAGGNYTTMSGKPYSFSEKEFLCSNNKIHNDLVKILLNG